MPKQQMSSAAVHVITGTLSDEPIQWATQSGVSMVVFSIKVVHRVGRDYQNTYYRVKTFGALADACLAHLFKGRLVQATGSDMSVWAYIDSKTGEARGVMELVAPSVIFLDPPLGFESVNVLPYGDIPFSTVAEEPAVAPKWEDVEFEIPNMAVVG
jgi:single-stranded DNA-binding protein